MMPLTLQSREIGCAAETDPSRKNMPEKTIKRRLEELDGKLADDDGPIFSTVAKLVKALDRAVPHSHDLEAKKEALRLGRELLRGTKYEEG
jgi:hypothetical protein